MLRLQWHKHYTPLALLLAVLLNIAQAQLVLHELQDHLFAGHAVNEHCLQIHVQGSALAGEEYHQVLLPITPVYDLAYHYGLQSLTATVYRSRAPPQHYAFS
jgi:hypothetical protein